MTACVERPVAVRVAALYRYPIKSAGGIRVDRLELDERGAAGDRRWMLVDEDRQFLSQRSVPRMALLRPALGGSGLAVDAPGMPRLAIAADGHPQADADGERLTATIWQDTVTVQRVGADADQWFSEFLAVRCSLVTMPADTHRQVDLQYAPPGRTVAFADGFPLLIVGTASLEELNRRLEAKGVSPVGFDRFRPNVVVTTDTPHEEDTWQRLVGAAIALDVVKPCARCAIVTVDQRQGKRMREPLATLSEYRRRGQQVLFAQNALHDRPGRLELGEPMVPGAPVTTALLPAPTPLWTGAIGVPHFAVDAAWPQPLPDNWMVGQVSGVAVDRHDHVWVIHRPATIEPDNPAVVEYSTPAPPVLELDPDGHVVGAWGGASQVEVWPSCEHSIHVDGSDHVWITGNGPTDHVALKFSRDGELVLQIGVAGRTGGSNDTALLGSPAAVDVDDAAHEIYIADGYLNRRVIVFDARTGAYRRHWGAYGRIPSDVDPGPYNPLEAPSTRFRTPVHAVRLARDGLLYVADRSSDRIQVFQKDGGFIKEAVIARATRGQGSLWGLALSPDAEQRYLYVADGTNHKVWIVRRHDLTIVGAFGRGGRNAGYFGWVHTIAVNSRGDVFTAEVGAVGRIQKFCATFELRS